MKKILLLLILFFTFPAYADVVIKYDEILKIRKALNQYYKLGVLIHKEFDLSNMGELRACVANYGNLRNEVKSIQEKVKKLNGFSYRFSLSLASQAAFICVYCGSSGKTCSDIPIEMEQVDSMLIEAGKLP